MQPLAQPASSTPSAAARHWRTLEEAKDRLERRYLIATLRRSRGCVTVAARRAGRDRSFFHQLLKKHNLDPKAYKHAPRRLYTGAVKSSCPRGRAKSWFGVPVQ